jgi:AcrR family transcriptional regulator
VARRLVRESGIGAVTMDLLAADANVGKGTLYRAFGSRAGLAEALVDDAERALQDAILTGPAPLGRGASPAVRLQAFVSAYLDLLAANADLLIETERGAPGARFHTGAYAFWHAHVSALLRQSGDPDPVAQAHTVLALLTADLYRHLRLEGLDPSRIQNAIQSMLDRGPTRTGTASVNGQSIGVTSRHAG